MTRDTLSAQAHDQDFATHFSLDWHRRRFEEFKRQDLFRYFGFQESVDTYAHQLDSHIDIGSGGGWLLSYTSPFFRRVVGIEPSAAGNATARALVGHLPNVELVEADMLDGLRALAVTRPVFVTTSTVLSHIEDGTVAEFLSAVNALPNGSVLHFWEPYDKNIQRRLWHLRSREWWALHLPDWELTFHDKQFQGYRQGISGVRVGRAAVMHSHKLSKQSRVRWALQGIYFRVRNILAAAAKSVLGPRGMATVRSFLKNRITGSFRFVARRIPVRADGLIRLAYAFARLSGQPFHLLPTEHTTAHATPRLAVRGRNGFWYTGDPGYSGDIAYGIFKSGWVEREGTLLVTDLLERLLALKPGKQLVFYDIGANTGYYGILATFHGKGQIDSFAFEPVGEFTAAARQSAVLNRLESNYAIFPLALGETNAEVPLYVAGTGTSQFKDFLSRPDAEERTVAQYRLDDLVAQEPLPLPDMVKIDVEGAEYGVVRGARSTIAAATPVIWFESSRTIKERGYDNVYFDPLIAELQAAGYVLWLCTAKKLVPLREAVIPDGTQMFLALHGEAHAALIRELPDAYPLVVEEYGL